MALRAGLIALALLGLFGAARAEENPRPLRRGFADSDGDL